MVLLLYAELAALTLKKLAKGITRHWNTRMRDIQGVVKDAWIITVNKIKQKTI
jgi:hypothetical protein